MRNRKDSQKLAITDKLLLIPFRHWW